MYLLSAATYLVDIEIILSTTNNESYDVNYNGSRCQTLQYTGKYVRTTEARLQFRL